MNNNRSKYQIDLVRKIQRGGAIVDIEGRVYSIEEPEIGAEAHYLGTIPRKMIPNRRKLEIRAKEVKEYLGKSEEPREEKRSLPTEFELVIGGCPTNAVGIAMYQLKYNKLP